MTTILGAMDGLTFTAYLITRVIPNLWPGACLVLDNSSTHRENEDIKTALEAVGAQIIYLSPYSPDFSPIELFWSKVKLENSPTMLVYIGRTVEFKQNSFRGRCKTNFSLAI